MTIRVGVPTRAETAGAAEAPERGDAAPAAIHEPEPVDMPSARDRQHEAGFLAAATRELGAPGAAFAKRVTARIDAGTSPYGDSFRWAGLRQLLGRAAEEAADIAGYAVLADQVLDERVLGCDPVLSAKARTEISRHLLEAAQHSSQAHAAIERARRIIWRGGR